ncbi:unnamed protein product [Ilex paraguariensis]|uniref:Root cap n=1 Tax=Ilex paraguariensis TaxID=185542 RepID=A0ABC8SGX4_9AQUA
MAQATTSFYAFSILLLMVAMAEGAPKAKLVKCKDKKFSDCYQQPLFCPADCLRTCVVDCVSCQPVCIAPPPPPPSPPPPPPKQKKRSPPPPPRSSPPPSPPPPTIVATPPPPPTIFASPPPPTPVANSTPPLPPPSPPLSPPPTSPSSTSPKKVYCSNKAYSDCYRMEHYCPSACPEQCEVDCVTCSPVCNCNKPGTVCQDPRFIGGDGITFYFHGKKGHDFCIVSDSNLHINAHFIGKRNQNMKRDFTWVQSIGILFDNHQLFLGAKKTATWNDAIDHLDLAFDGESISLPDGDGATWTPALTLASVVSITRSHDTNAVVIEVEGNFQIRATVVPISEKDSIIHNYGITEEDCFAHLDLGFKFYTLSGDVNGVLGQTYAGNYVSRVKMGINMPVLGGEREFSSTSLFSTDCAVARFNGSSSASSKIPEVADMNCASRIDGSGVICKR